MNIAAKKEYCMICKCEHIENMHIIESETDILRSIIDVDKKYIKDLINQRGWLETDIEILKEEIQHKDALIKEFEDVQHDERKLIKMLKEYIQELENIIKQHETR